MGKNRRHHSGAVRLVPALKAVLLCALIGGSCVGYVLQLNKIYDLGNQTRIREGKLERLKRDNQLLADRLAAEQSPLRLAERVKQLRLGLVSPEPGQVIWIDEGRAPSGATNLIPVNMVPVNSAQASARR